MLTFECDNSHKYVNFNAIQIGDVAYMHSVDGTYSHLILKITSDRLYVFDTKQTMHLTPDTCKYSHLFEIVCAKMVLS